MFNPKYLYFFVCLALSIIWFIPFFFRKDLRRENLSVSLLVGALTFLFAPLFLQNYWTPQTIFATHFAFENFLFGFFTAGICSTIYEEIFGKHFGKKRDLSRNWELLLFPLVALNLGIFLLEIYLGINPIYAHISSLLILAGIFMLMRHDLLRDSVMSGFLFGIIYFLVFSLFLFVFPEGVKTWWHTSNLSGRYVYGIPLEELLWAFSWGMCCGPFYEFFKGFKYK